MKSVSTLPFRVDAVFLLINDLNGKVLSDFRKMREIVSIIPGSGERQEITVESFDLATESFHLSIES